MAEGLRTIYFVRHGKTEWNMTGQMQGWGDSPLVAEGIDGAKAVGEVLKDTQLDAVYTSTSKRTKDTAAYILADRDIEIRELEELKEMHFGTWEGVTVTEIDEKYPEERAKILHSPETYKAEVNGGETYYELAERLQQGVEKIIAETPSGNILVVSHGMSLTLLLYLLQGGTVEDHRKEAPRILNTSISIVEYENGEFTLKKLNEIDHLNLK
ncbi:histidine phosphatase family protein [Listeria ivanovii]|uniref:Histidine phosphatase family protein n=2 Tax=Listeria ivanovii TaxID=1638 RepID=A0ABS1G596_LISIV|nr:histidine phosphatase family protein [Listeria ivanovii]EFR98289.1 phosphoglycerate mutase family protein [Listeria ivanovii FSL F6-596]AIS58730.1 phosphoglycerate mutase [Listeria ivanovii subsp. londoniensis]AIS61536.1 phosphoglycerate mutase [Listeria ivanovii subsp. londoniensis]MBC2254357.1 histidine phosphatase family protein [Listeria ivanovii]MBK1962049.1 histidine phosphatase family protein [Listeria ivanovii subsp. londoniensis]